MLYPALAASGFAIGILSGLLGIGGGTMIIPLLRLAFGVDPLVAVGTSLFTIIPTSISGVVGHLRNHTAALKPGIIFGLFGALCSPVGSILSERAGGTVVMVTASAVIVFTAVRMLLGALRTPKRDAPAGDAALQGGTRAVQAGGPSSAVAASGPERTGLKDLQITPRIFVLAAFIGVVAGLMSGFIGVGGGFMIVPLSLWLLHLDMKQAAGTSLVAVFILAIPGAITHGMLGGVAYLAGLALAAGSIPGAFLGSILIRRVPDRTLRFVFGIVLIVVGVLLAVNEFV